MTKPAFTPGPWEYDPDTPISHDIYGGKKGFHICAATSGFSEKGMTEANAHLIAAAPDMYEALKAALERGSMNEQPDWHLIRTAVAKAEGRDS